MKETPKQTALEARETKGEKLFSPSAARNGDPIRDVFLKHMPAEGRYLEVGAGTGEHAVHIVSALPEAHWLTGDPDAAACASISAWIADAGLPNLAGPHTIDVTKENWGVEDNAPFHGVVSINMIHIAPFEAAQGLFKGAGRLLTGGGKLFLYGPFKRRSVHHAASNQSFDENLKSRDPRWGVRDLDLELMPLAQANGLTLEMVVEMPANNFSVIFRKT
ncbi:DUF938 domain-containing protein [Hyphococcus sp.]|uniref:DUF938 domain-containing protein n=1 Tax=Hyphococcus sp. TaxID=2038636 RepID=UPI003CCB84D2